MTTSLVGTLDPSVTVRGMAAWRGIIVSDSLCSPPSISLYLDSLPLSNAEATVYNRVGVMIWKSLKFISSLH